MNRRAGSAATDYALRDRTGATRSAQVGQIYFGDRKGKWVRFKSALTTNCPRSGSASDPRAQLALDRLKRAWDTAPTVPAMDNQLIRIAGFVVPLEGEGDQLREFLLVPYFGACIHVPPPPANQIIHVTSDKPIKGVRTMDALWVSGRLHLAISDTAMGTSGYRMEAQFVAPYKEKR